MGDRDKTTGVSVQRDRVQSLKPVPENEPQGAEDFAATIHANLAEGPLTRDLMASMNSRVSRSRSQDFNERFKRSPLNRAVEQRKARDQSDRELGSQFEEQDANRPAVGPTASSSATWTPAVLHKDTNEEFSTEENGDPSDQHSSSVDLTPTQPAGIQLAPLSPRAAVRAARVLKATRKNGCTITQIMRATGIRSRQTVWSAVKDLTERHLLWAEQRGPGKATRFHKVEGKNETTP